MPRQQQQAWADPYDSPPVAKWRPAPVNQRGTLALSPRQARGGRRRRRSPPAEGDRPRQRRQPRRAPSPPQSPPKQFSSDEEDNNNRQDNDSPRRRRSTSPPLSPIAEQPPPIQQQPAASRPHSPYERREPTERVRVRQAAHNRREFKGRKVRPAGQPAERTNQQNSGQHRQADPRGGAQHSPDPPQDSGWGDGYSDWRRDNFENAKPEDEVDDLPGYAAVGFADSKQPWKEDDSRPHPDSPDPMKHAGDEPQRNGPRRNGRQGAGRDGNRDHRPTVVDDPLMLPPGKRGQAPDNDADAWDPPSHGKDDEAWKEPSRGIDDSYANEDRRSQSRSSSPDENAVYGDYRDDESRQKHKGEEAGGHKNESSRKDGPNKKANGRRDNEAADVTEGADDSKPEKPAKKCIIS